MGGLSSVEKRFDPGPAGVGAGEDNIDVMLMEEGEVGAFHPVVNVNHLSVLPRNTESGAGNLGRADTGNYPATLAAKVLDHPSGQAVEAGVAADKKGHALGIRHLGDSFKKRSNPAIHGNLFSTDPGKEGEETGGTGHHLSFGDSFSSLVSEVTFAPGAAADNGNREWNNDVL